MAKKATSTKITLKGKDTALVIRENGSPEVFFPSDVTMEDVLTPHQTLLFAFVFRSKEDQEFVDGLIEWFQVKAAQAEIDALNALEPANEG